MVMGCLSTMLTMSEPADEEKLRRENWRAARQLERWTSPRRAEGSTPSPFGGAVVYAMGWAGSQGDNSGRAVSVCIVLCFS